MNKLPTELYLQIFEKVPQKDLRGSVSLVCKEWLQLLHRFQLVENKLVITSPFNYRIEKLLNDFPEYAKNVKYLKLVDRCEREDGMELESDDEDEDRDYDAENISVVINACQKLEKLKIWFKHDCAFSNVLPEILNTEIKFGSSLTVLEFDLQDMYTDRKYIIPGPPVTVDMNKLLNYTFPNLQHLTIHSTAKEAGIAEDMYLEFTCSNQYPETSHSIKSIKILNHGALMTKDCLNYFISGKLTMLEELEISLSLIESVENENVVEVEDNIYNNLKDFCSISLKKYKLTFLDDEEEIFKIINNNDDKEAGDKD